MPLMDALTGISDHTIEDMFRRRGTWKARRRVLRMKRGAIKPTVRPDIDNISKIITDALNGVAYLDDKQIVHCRASKHYWDAPAVQVWITELSEDVA